MAGRIVASQVLKARVSSIEARLKAAGLDYSRADRFEHGGARFEVTLQCVFEDKLKLEL